MEFEQASEQLDSGREGFEKDTGTSGSPRKTFRQLCPGLGLTLPQPTEAYSELGPAVHALPVLAAMTEHGLCQVLTFILSLEGHYTGWRNEAPFR